MSTLPTLKLHNSYCSSFKTSLSNNGRTHSTLLVEHMSVNQ